MASLTISSYSPCDRGYYFSRFKSFRGFRFPQISLTYFSASFCGFTKPKIWQCCISIGFVVDFFSFEVLNICSICGILRSERRSWSYFSWEKFFLDLGFCRDAKLWGGLFEEGFWCQFIDGSIRVTTQNSREYSFVVVKCEGLRRQLESFEQMKEKGRRIEECVKGWVVLVTSFILRPMCRSTIFRYSVLNFLFFTLLDFLRWSPNMML